MGPDLAHQPAHTESLETWLTRLIGAQGNDVQLVSCNRMADFAESPGMFTECLLIFWLPWEAPRNKCTS